MKTIGLVVRPDGSRWWRRFANSVPIDGTLTTTTENNRCIIWFQVAHVHVAADQDIRVLCLVPNDGASEDMAYKSTLFQQDKVNWRILGREDLPDANKRQPALFRCTTTKGERSGLRHFRPFAFLYFNYCVVVLAVPVLESTASIAARIESYGWLPGSSTESVPTIRRL